MASLFYIYETLRWFPPADIKTLFETILGSSKQKYRHFSKSKRWYIFSQDNSSKK